MAINILGCLILELDTGQPLYSHFFDKMLKQDPSVIPNKVRSKELKLVHELGVHAAYTAIVKQKAPEVTQYLKAFKERVEETFPEGLKRGQGSFADYVILQNIVSEVFI